MVACWHQGISMVWRAATRDVAPNSCHPTYLVVHAGVQDKGGIIPALQKLSFAGKHMNDPQRTLEQ